MSRICIFCGRSFEPCPTVLGGMTYAPHLINSIALVQNVRRQVVGSGRRRNLPQMRHIEPIRLIVRGPGGGEILTTGGIIARHTRYTLKGTGSSNDNAIPGSDSPPEKMDP